jgi:predicted DsbA family dithiol-disulfide isomerase
MSQQKMMIEVFTDIQCPWCYIGKRRLDRAIEQFEHRDQVEVVWRGYQLDPGAPFRYDGTVYDLVARRYGMNRQQAVAQHDELAALAALDGLQYRFDHTKPGNSLDALRLVHLGARHGLAAAVEEKLMRAYFTEGVHLGDHEALVRLAIEVGLDAAESRQALASDAFADDVRADRQRARALGLRGVPAFIFDDKVLVSGAQSIEALASALRRVWGESGLNATTRTMETCDDGACAVPEAAPESP